MELRPLRAIPGVTLHRAFSEAFSDYAVPLRLDPSALSELHRRRGVRYDLSPGAFDGERLVGFTFNGLGPWNGTLTGYDAGTGVLPQARGQGLARRMMERSLTLLAAEGAKRYVLEVLQTNDAAIAIYTDVGFRTRRELLCWRLGDVRAREVPGLELRSAESLAALDLDLDSAHGALGLRDWHPSWQNSSESIRRAAEARTILIAKVDGALAGYAIVFRRGDLAQLAVAETMRRRGIGTELVRAARRHASADLTITNTDADNAPTTGFLEALGAHERARQHEMWIEL